MRDENFQLHSLYPCNQSNGSKCKVLHKILQSSLLEILRFVREQCQELQLLANLPGVMPGKPLANCNFKPDKMPGANPTQNRSNP